MIESAEGITDQDGARENSDIHKGRGLEGRKVELLSHMGA